MGGPPSMLVPFMLHTADDKLVGIMKSAVDNH